MENTWVRKKCHKDLHSQQEYGAYATQLGEQKLSRNDLSFKGGTYTHWAFKARFPLTKFQGRRIKKKKREREEETKSMVCITLI